MVELRSLEKQDEKWQKSNVSDIQICSLAHQSGNTEGTPWSSKYNRGMKTDVQIKGVEEGVIKRETAKQKVTQCAYKVQYQFQSEEGTVSM